MSSSDAVLGQVLDSGALPPGVLSDRIDSWIASQKPIPPQ